MGLYLPAGTLGEGRFIWEQADQSAEDGSASFFFFPFFFLTDINQQIKVFADAHGLLNPDDMGVSLGPIMGELNNLDVALPASVKPATAND